MNDVNEKIIQAIESANNLYAMYCQSNGTIINGKISIEYHWINKEAEKYYNEIMDLLKELMIKIRDRI